MPGGVAGERPMKAVPYADGRANQRPLRGESLLGVRGNDRRKYRNLHADC